MFFDFLFFLPFGKFTIKYTLFGVLPFALRIFFQILPIWARFEKTCNDSPEEKFYKVFEDVLFPHSYLKLALQKQASLPCSHISKVSDYLYPIDRVL